MLADAGYKVEVFEEEDQIGGMCRSIRLFDQFVDLGSHRFFSKDQRIKDFWEKSMPADEFLTVQRLSRILYKGKFYYYPLRGLDALKKLGIIEATLCVLSYLKACVLPFKGNNFEAWVSNAFGYRLYSIFFKTYSEKLWGIKCTDLDSAFASQRIKSFNLKEAIKTALFGNKDEHQTLLSHFLYPKMGCGEVYESVAKRLRKLGCVINTGCRVTKIRTEDHKVKGINFIKDGQEQQRDFDIVVSSAVFTEMVASLDELSAESKKLASTLHYRNTLLVYLLVDKKIFKDNWIYVHSPNIATGRISNFANWSTYAQNGHPENVICMEYWANTQDEFWHRPDAELIELAKEDLVKTGLAVRDNIKGGELVRLEKSYPIYSAGYLETLKPITKELDTFQNLYFIGRNGSFKYNNQDHSILMGLLCADKIKGKFSGSLWNINSDSNYQEEGKL